MNEENRLFARISIMHQLNANCNENHNKETNIQATEREIDRADERDSIARD